MWCFDGIVSSSNTVSNKKNVLIRFVDTNTSNERFQHFKCNTDSTDDEIEESTTPFVNIINDYPIVDEDL